MCRYAQVMFTTFLQFDGHALSELAGVWDVDCIYITPVEHGGKGEIVWLRKKDVGDASLLS